MNIAKATGSNVLDNLNTVEQNILNLVRIAPDVCDNYNKLCSTYWIIFDNVANLDDLKNATPAESITRAYRMLVSEGLVQQTRRTAYRRSKLENEYRQSLSCPKQPNYIRC